MNNAVRNYRGEIVGFRCFVCGEVKDRMWGPTCNACRERQDNQKKLLAEIANLQSTVALLQSQSR